MTTERRKTLLINILTIVIFLVMAEIVSRVILNKIYNRDFDSSLIVDNKYFTSSGLKPNATGVVWGKPFHTDAFGCRRNRSVYDTRKKKWLFIGDSVTEGVGVDDSLTFASIFSQHCDSFNVLNYSLIGYSITDYLNVLRANFLSSKGTISRVTIFFCLNDVYGSAPVSKLPRMSKHKTTGSMSAWLQQHYSTYKLLKLVAFQRSDSYFRYDLQFYDPVSPYFSDAMNTLEQCYLLCKTFGVKMNVVMLPYASQLQGRNEDEYTPQLLVAQYCADHGIDFSEPSTFFKRPSDPATSYLFADEIHFSPKGHLLMAHYLLSQ